MAIALAILLGACVIAGVLAYYLRRISRVLAATGALHEAALNRAAMNRGDRPISDDVNPRDIF